MNNLQFISYVETPAEKYKGIASIQYNGILLRYKIVNRTDGKGWFPASASIKSNPRYDGKDSYESAFEIDSRSLTDQILEFIRHHVQMSMNGTSAKPQNLAQTSRPIAQRIQNEFPSIPSDDGRQEPANAFTPPDDFNLPF